MLGVKFLAAPIHVLPFLRRFPGCQLAARREDLARVSPLVAEYVSGGVVEATGLRLWLRCGCVVHSFCVVVENRIDHVSHEV